MSLSIDVFNSQNMYKCEKLYTKIVHISLNFALKNVKSRVAVDDIRLEGTVLEF